jgi:hypothetical protein
MWPTEYFTYGHFGFNSTPFYARLTIEQYTLKRTVHATVEFVLGLFIHF